MVKILTVVSAALVIVVGVGVYLLVSTNRSASAAGASASALLERADSDTKQINSALQEPTTPEITSTAQHPDFQGAKQRLDAFVSRIDRTRSTVAADAANLRSTDAQLKQYKANLLVLSSHSALDRQQRRVAAMRSALGAADAALIVERDQVRTLSAVMDAFDGLATLLDSLNRGDVIGGVAMISVVDAKLQSAAGLAKVDSNPIQVDLLIADMRLVLRDIQSVLEAVQRRDTAAEQSLSKQIDTDVKAYNDLHLASLPTYEQTVMQPHVDRYRAGLQAAGFTDLTNGGSPA